MTAEATEQSVKEKKSVPVWLLTTVLVTLIIGVVAGLIAQNVLSKQQVSLSAPDLISFVFTVALGAASIILAIITIVLSRQAEDALIRRSDEGIRLQNDVFVRTNEVLSKIQSSTGVTEKRIEDIISGRTTSIIAQEVLDKSFPGKSELRGPEFERLKKDLADSLRSELLPLVAGGPTTALERLQDMEHRQKAQAQREVEWREYRAAVVTALQCLANVQLISEAHGDLDAEEPEKFWDAIFQINDRKIGFDIHTRRQFRQDGAYQPFLTDEGTKKFASQIALRALQDDLDSVCLVINEAVTAANPLQKTSNLLQKLLPNCTVWLLGGSAEQVAEQFREKVLSAQQNI